MTTPKKIGLVSIELLMAGVCALPEVVPAQTSLPPLDRRVGCVYQDADGMRFIDTQHRTKAQTGADVMAARQAGTPINSCLTGQLRMMPAVTYSALASKYPGKYKPLPSPTPAAPPAPSFASNNPTLHWTYFGLDALAPSPFLPFVTAFGLTNDGRVYGSILDPDFNPYVVQVQNGQLTILAPGLTLTASDSGIVGGVEVLDAANNIFQAAIIRGNNVTTIPFLANEVTSAVLHINDVGLAIVAAFDAGGAQTWSIFSADGTHERIDFGLGAVSIDVTGLNNFGIASGTAIFDDGRQRAFRYDTSTKITTLLLPFSVDQDSAAQNINNLGEVVGWSRGPGVERVGVWHMSNRFETYFVEGTAEVPTVSQTLVINDRNVIVISDVSAPPADAGKSFILPRKGERIDLADQVSGAPSKAGALGLIAGMNDRGQIIGSSEDGVDFLLTPAAPPR